jgi:hypothetical protein
MLVNAFVMSAKSTVNSARARASARAPKSSTLLSKSAVERALVKLLVALGGEVNFS